MFTLKRLPSNIITNFSPKRDFWKISEECMTIKIKSVGQVGYLFNHTNVLCSLNNFGNNEGNISFSFNASLSKYSISHKLSDAFVDSNNMIDMQINCVVETHILGLPTKGFIVNPKYIKSIQIV